MKKLVPLCLAFALSLCLAACGDPGAADVPGRGSAYQAPGAAGTEEELGREEPEEEAPASVEVRFEVGRETWTNEDGVLLATGMWQKPNVTKRESMALERIQADLDAEAESYLEKLGLYAEAAQSHLDQAKRSFESYYLELAFFVQRNDGRVLSLEGSLISYLGGVHGSDYRFTLNYDVATGERITLETLGEVFFQAAWDEVLIQAGEMTAEKGGNALGQTVCGDYADYIGDVVCDDAFYFSGEGVTFISRQYVMQSYAAGIIEFTMPYAQANPLLPECYQG